MSRLLLVYHYAELSAAWRIVDARSVTHVILWYLPDV